MKKILALVITFSLILNVTAYAGNTQIGNVERIVNKVKKTYNDFKKYEIDFEDIIENINDSDISEYEIIHSLSGNIKKDKKNKAHDIDKLKSMKIKYEINFF